MGQFKISTSIQKMVYTYSKLTGVFLYAAPAADNRFKICLPESTITLPAVACPYIWSLCWPQSS